MPALTFEPGAVRRISLAVLAALLGSYLMVLAGLYFGQRSLLYQPTTTEVAPTDAGLPQVEAHRLVMPDGARLVLWSVPPTAGKETILYFHGNGGN